MFGTHSKVHERQTARMRTRSEWFLGDGACDDGDEDSPCACRNGGPCNSAIGPPDEMDLGGHERALLSKRPASQLFEGSAAECGAREGREDGTDFTSHMFGTLSPNAFSCACNRNRLHCCHARIEEEESSLNELHVGDRISFTADTHRRPVVHTSSPYSERRSGIRKSTDSNNNRDRRRIRPEDAFDEIMVLSLPGIDYCGTGEQSRLNAKRPDDGLVRQRRASRSSVYSDRGDDPSDQKIMILCRILDFIF